MGLLADKTAVVTGGSSGIGLATAQRFVDEGATVIITGRRRTKLDAAAAQLGLHAHAVPGDVTVPADLGRLYDAAERLGGLDIVSPTPVSAMARRWDPSARNTSRSCSTSTSKELSSPFRRCCP